jgi:hypothetical protein
MQKQWRIPNDKAHEDLIMALSAVCNPHKCNRIVRIPEQKMELFVFNSQAMTRQIQQHVGVCRLETAGDLTREICNDLGARQSALIVREGDESLVLSVSDEFGAYEQIYKQARGLQVATTDLALSMTPVLAPLE